MRAVKQQRAGYKFCTDAIRIQRTVRRALQALGNGQRKRMPQAAVIQHNSAEIIPALQTAYAAKERTAALGRQIKRFTERQRHGTVINQPPLQFGNLHSIADRPQY